MSQNPHPHDPFAADADTSAAQPEAPQPEAPQFQDPQFQDPQAPAHDVAAGQPSHDPYAYDAQASEGGLLDVDSAPSAQPSAPAPATAAPQAQPPAQHPVPSPYSAPATGGQQAPQGAYAASAGEGPDLPPAGTRGVYDGPLSGEPVSRSDSRLWATIAQAAVAVGHVVSWGFLGWIGPLVVFLMYKDRDRLVRFHAAEALNGAIAVVITQLVLTIAVTILTVFTFGIGSILYPLVGLPALLQLVFSIIGAVKANRGEYWTYPVNIRLVK